MKEEDKDLKNKTILTMLQGQAEKDAVADVHRLLSNFMRDTKQLLEVQEMVSKLRKGKYDALIKAGFKEEQALKIVAASDFTNIF